MAVKKKTIARLYFTVKTSPPGLICSRRLQIAFEEFLFYWNTKHSRGLQIKPAGLAFIKK